MPHPELPVEERDQKIVGLIVVRHRGLALRRCCGFALGNAFGQQRARPRFRATDADRCQICLFQRLRGCAKDFANPVNDFFVAGKFRLGQRQIGRICRAAEEFVGGEPGGSLTEMRFDIGLVDARGDLRILENALAA